MKGLLKGRGVIFLILALAVLTGIFWGKGRIGNRKAVSQQVRESSAEMARNDITEVNAGESESGSEAESDLWFLPQAESCLISEAEKNKLENNALTAAQQIKEVYKDIELIDQTSYGSNIKEFTKEQRRAILSMNVKI